MRTLLLALSLIYSATTMAGNIVLLTSLDLEAPKLAKLEKMFVENFKERSSDLVIKHRVSPEELFATLTSTATEQLFWVSHAAAGKELKEGLQSNDVILDVQGNDVHKFFTTTTPHLKFMAIIGCEAEAIIEGFKARGNYDDRPNLGLFSFSKKTKIFKGFRQALEASKVVGGQSQEADYRVPTFVSITARIKPQSASETRGWIEMGDRVLGVFGGDTKVVKAEVSTDLWTSMNNANIQVYRSKEMNESAKLPILSFTVNGHANAWSLFSDAKGQAIGRGDKDLYVYKLN